jgi:hypothetical protein
MTIAPHRLEEIETAQRIAAHCHSFLTGHRPAVQGAALASLLATWLAGHAPELREALLDAHIHLVRELVSLTR